MAALSAFQDGVLPPGDYEMTIADLLRSELVLGFGQPKERPTWDAAWRERLVVNLSVLIGQLSYIGITEVFIDGSFVEDKDHPNDIDGYFVCDMQRLASGELQRELNLLDPHKIWIWDPDSRRPFPGFPKRQLPMWHVYRVELYPHYGQICGILDEHGHELTFPAAFRKTRGDHRPKGIIKLNLTDGQGAL